MLLLTITNRIELIHFLWTHDITGKPFILSLHVAERRTNRAQVGSLNMAVLLIAWSWMASSYKTKTHMETWSQVRGPGEPGCRLPSPETPYPHMSSIILVPHDRSVLIVVSELIPSLQRELRTLTQIGWYSNDINAYIAFSVCWMQIHY